MLAVTLSLCALLAGAGTDVPADGAKPATTATAPAASTTTPTESEKAVAADKSADIEKPADDEAHAETAQPAAPEADEDSAQSDVPADAAKSDGPANAPAKVPTDEPGSDEPAAEDAPEPDDAGGSPERLRIEIHDRPPAETRATPKKVEPAPDIDDELEAEPANPFEGSSAAPLTPDLQRLRDQVRQALAFYFRRPVNSRENTPWEVFHWIIGYNVQAELRADGPTGPGYNAIGWMCFNRTCAGQRLLTVEHGRVRALYGVGLQGHEGQFLAILAQSMVAPDYPMQVGRQKFTVRDLVQSEQLGCTTGHDVELMFKLIGLSHYLDLDEVWRNSAGETWSFPRIIREEIVKPIQGSACGGTHRLMGLSYASQMRMRRGQPLDGEYLRAANYIRDYQIYTLGMQNPDGSFSTAWFARREDRNDIDRKIQTTGHILEWLVFSLPEADLRHPQVVRAVNFISGSLMADRKHAWEIGPLGHALRALSLYDRRVFRPAETAVPPQIVQQPRRRPDDRQGPPTPRAGSRPTRDTAAIPSADAATTAKAAPNETEPRRLTKPTEAVKVPIEVEPAPTEEPAAESPLDDKPANDEPVAVQPMEEPNADTPDADEPVVAKPVEEPIDEAAVPTEQPKEAAAPAEEPKVEEQNVEEPEVEEKPIEAEPAPADAPRSTGEATTDESNARHVTPQVVAPPVNEAQTTPKKSVPSLGPSVRLSKPLKRKQSNSTPSATVGNGRGQEAPAADEPALPAIDEPVEGPGPECADQPGQPAAPADKDSDLMIKSLHPREAEKASPPAKAKALKEPTESPAKTPAVLSPALLHKARELGEREARRRTRPASKGLPTSSNGWRARDPLSDEPRLIAAQSGQQPIAAEATDAESHVRPTAAEEPISDRPTSGRGGVVRSARKPRPARDE